MEAEYKNFNYIFFPECGNINTILPHHISFLLFRINVPGDRMSRLASHLLKQKCFYPLYPADDDICIDIELLYQYGIMNVKPHILILPSNFMFFAKVSLIFYLT